VLGEKDDAARSMTEAADVVEKEVLQLERPNRRFADLRRLSGALVVGDPRGNLDHARSEAAGIAKELRTDALIGDRATKAAVLDRIGDASHIHLATHAEFDLKTPLNSSITLADGYLTGREIMEVRIKADLVALSACETGLSRPLGGDELAGLAQALFYAGARSLIVSLWRVNDRSTAELFRKFYRALDNNSDRAVALSKAIIALKAQRRWSDPYHWGAFQIMGNWE
jgi:CHAT domain-containing protein